MDFSIIIPHRGSGLGLWATIHSCEIELKQSDFRYNYFIVSNGEKKLDVDAARTIKFLTQTGKLGEHLHSEEALAPQYARQRGANIADGETLFFFDNHCLVDKDFFRRAVADMDHFKMDMLHSTTMFYSGEEAHYHYRLKLVKNFWAESSLIPQHPLKPYRCAMAGHGGFAVRKRVFDEVGGYGPEGLFTGYGGEETYFDLKMALLDKSNWIDPKVVHYHYAGKRGYARHYTDDYFRNMMTCALVIGGERWMMKVFETFARFQPKHNTGKCYYDLLQEAWDRGHEHAAHIASIRNRTLDEQLEQFVSNQIAYD